MSTQVAIALISVGGTLGGGIVTFAGSFFLQSVKASKDARAARTHAQVDALAAAVEFNMGIGIMRSAWVDNPGILQRTIKAHDAVADMNTILLPKLDRLVRALAVISLWKGKKDRDLVVAVEQLTDAAGELAEAMGNSSADVYGKSVESFQKALSNFRRRVDGREPLHVIENNGPPEIEQAS